MSEIAPLTVDPAFDKRATLEAVCEHLGGDPTRARTLAMMAGIDAGVLGLRPHECPQDFLNHSALTDQWHWGRNHASTANGNAQQKNLL